MPSSVSVLKRGLSLRFRRFLTLLAAALLLEPLFLALDSACNCLRFGDSSSLPEKLFECYCLFHALFAHLTTKAGLPFSRRALPFWLLQTVLLKYIFNQFFQSAALVLWRRSAALLAGWLYNAWWCWMALAVGWVGAAAVRGERGGAMAKCAV